MDDVMISLLAPVSRRPGLDSWVEEQVDRLRTQSRSSDVLLGRLVRARPAYGGDWLIKVDRSARGGPLEKDIALATIMAELEWLGLRPALFVTSPRAGALAAARRPSRTRRRETARHRPPRARRSRPL